MQTIEMLQTIKWISDQYSEKTRRTLFSTELFNRPPDHDKILDLLNATHEVSRVRATVLAHPSAVQVLEAFNLSEIVDETWPVRLSSVTGGGERDVDLMQELHNLLIGTIRQWSMMLACVEPVQKLTTPPEVAAEKDFDEILTIDIRSEKEITVDSLSKVFMHASELYEGIARLMGITQGDRLQVIYVASGSSQRFDLRGLGEPIKRLKELIMELWQQIRYQRFEEAHRNNNVILNSLTVLEKIEAQRKKNALNDNEAELLRTQIFKSTMGLLDQGALIREIPPVETVQNQQLLEDRQQRLLPAPPETGTKAGDLPKSRRGKNRQTSPRRARQHQGE